MNPSMAIVWAECRGSSAITFRTGTICSDFALIHGFKEGRLGTTAFHNSNTCNQLRINLEENWTNQDIV